MMPCSTRTVCAKRQTTGGAAVRHGDAAANGARHKGWRSGLARPPCPSKRQGASPSAVTFPPQFHGHFQDRTRLVGFKARNTGPRRELNPRRTHYEAALDRSWSPPRPGIAWNHWVSSPPVSSRTSPYPPVSGTDLQRGRAQAVPQRELRAAHARVDRVAVPAEGDGGLGQATVTALVTPFKVGTIIVSTTPVSPSVGWGTTR